MKITWLGVVAIGVLLLTGYRGYRRGFVREILSFFFVFLTLAIAWAMNPYINDFIMEKTPVYTRIQESCQDLVKTQMNEQAQDSTEADENDSNRAIEKLALPDILQKNLEQNNTTEMYQYLAVDSFADYVTGYLARTIINGISYLISYILANLILRVVMCILDAVTGLPLINGANRVTGGMIGVAKGLLFIWIAFLLLTVLCSTEIGKKGLELVEQDTFLSVLYKYDIFVNVFADIF
ncbi:CvpA family protein [Blautia sp. MSJ-19]|uniref:CvpA family protein n=1 Tax=Blautia sp. MSJ-19 TaxID=2841517 RepID=UPI001C0F182F|nr:CvpA family protein [Blautia sp. MSJ-19]MBU5482498.1 CvpA family protein [Blautia sp. MSJ-19]